MFFFFYHMQLNVKKEKEAKYDYRSMNDFGKNLKRKKRIVRKKNYLVLVQYYL